MELLSVEVGIVQFSESAGHKKVLALLARSGNYR